MNIQADNKAYVLNTWRSGSCNKLQTCTCFQCPWIMLQLHQILHKGWWHKHESGNWTIEQKLTVSSWTEPCERMSSECLLIEWETLSKMTTTSTTTTMANSITSRCTTRLYYDLLTTPKPYRSSKRTDQTKPKSICKSLGFYFFEEQNLCTCRKYFWVHCWDILCQSQYNLIQHFLRYSNILFDWIR